MSDQPAPDSIRIGTNSDGTPAVAVPVSPAEILAEIDPATVETAALRVQNRKLSEALAGAVNQPVPVAEDDEGKLEEPTRDEQLRDEVMAMTVGELRKALGLPKSDRSGKGKLRAELLAKRLAE